MVESFHYLQYLLDADLEKTKMQAMLQDNASPIVFVDDNQFDRDLINYVYVKLKYKNPLLLMGEGMQLLNYLEKVKRGQEILPAIVLLDINMPEMDGFEVLEKIRTQSLFQINPFIIILTSSRNPEDVKKSYQLGANGYQEKPFELDSYADLFKSLIPQSH